MTSPGRSVLVVSGDALFAEAAAVAVRSRGWTAAGPMPDGLSAVASVSRRAPDAVLVIGDELARLGPVPMAQQIRRRWPEVAIVVVGAVETPHAAVLSAGCTLDEVFAALAAPTGRPVAAEIPADRAGMSVLSGLTARQRLVLRLLVDGKGMRDIAAELALSENTVRTHMQNLYAKLGCHSRLELVRFARAQGLLSDEPGQSSG